MEEAARLDDQLIAAWTGHPHFRVIDNATGFEEKMKRLISEVAAFLGEPQPYEIERKFLIEYPDVKMLESLPNCHRVELIQTYLKSSADEEVRVRQRGEHGNYIYYKTVKKKVTSMKRLEVESRLTQREYVDLLMDADTSCRQIRKTRYCLMYHSQYFEVDIYPFWQDKAIVEIQLTNEKQKIDFPVFLYMIDFDGADTQKAIDYLTAAAEKGHSYAQYTLGKLFLTRENDTQSAYYALYWLEESAKQDNTDAQCLLGKVLLRGEVTDQDTDRAAELLKKAIANGSAYASYLLGKEYLDGTVLLQDVPEAIRLLTLSADKGFTPAEYLLGKIYYRGEVIPQDIPKALVYLESAAENENPYAAYLAGKIFLTEDAVKDVQKAIRLLKASAAQENDYAEYQLGKLYLYGKDVPQDYEEAIRWLTASAEHGNQYAGQLLHNIRNNRNWSAAMGAFRLLHHISRIIQNRLEDERRGKDGAHIDRKLRRRIQDKNEALGIKQG